MPCTLTFVGLSQYTKKVQKLIAIVPAKSIEPPPPKKLKAEALVIVEDEVEDEQTSTSGTNPQWLKFQGCLLTEKDREAIVSNDLLNDRHIDYAQTLLHYQFPQTEGLHNTLLQKKNRQQQIKMIEETTGLLLQPLIVIGQFKFTIQFILQCMLKPLM